MHDPEHLFRVGLGHPDSAQAAFTNRVGELTAFARSLASVAADIQDHPEQVLEVRQRPRRNVLVFHGMGGVGKSELSRELEQRFLAGEIGAKAAERASVRIDFERPDALDAEEILLRLRGGLGPLLRTGRAFDLAFAAYWERARPGTLTEVFGRRASSWRRLAERIGMSDSVVEILDSVLDTAGTVSASRRVSRAVGRGVLDWAAQRGLTRDCAFFQPILEMRDVETMRSYLPILLAWDLSLAQRQRATEAVVFFDTWERVQVQPDGSLDAEDRLTRAIYLMPNVLFVLTVSQAGFDGDLDPRFRPGERRPSPDVYAEEVPGGVARASRQARVGERPTDRGGREGSRCRPGVPAHVGAPGAG